MNLLVSDYWLQKILEYYYNILQTPDVPENTAKNAKTKKLFTMNHKFMK